MNTRPILSDRRILPALLTLLLVVTFLPWIGDTLFNTKGEPREALVALSMINSGDYILPTSYGTDIPYKPPFLAWLIVGASHLTSGGHVTEFSSRLPSVLATMALVLGFFVWMRRTTRNDMLSLTAAIITFTSVEVFRAATACRVDMVLTACTVLSILVMVSSSMRRGRPAVSFAGILLMTCAVLTKGPVGMVLPCLVTGIFLLMRGHRFLPTLGVMTANGLLALVIPALWYYAAWLEGGDRFLRLAMEENFGRFTGTMSYDSHLNPWPYNIVTIVAGMAPYTLLALLSLFSLRKLAARRPQSLRRIREGIMNLDDASLLSLTACTVIFVFYCFPASKRSVYLLPMYPFMAYFTARLWMAMARVRAKSLTAYATVIASVSLLACWTVWGLHIVDASGAGLKGAALDLTTGLYAEPFGIADWTLLIVAILAAAYTLVIAVKRSMMTRIAATLATTLSLLWVLSATILPRTLNPKSDIVLAREIERVDPAVEQTYSFNAARMMRYFTTAFYLGDRVRLFAPETGSSQSVDTVSTPLPPSGYLLVSEPDFEQWSELYGRGYTVDTVYHATRRSGDTRRPTLILHFNQNESR